MLVKCKGDSSASFPETCREGLEQLVRLRVQHEAEVGPEEPLHALPPAALPRLAGGGVGCARAEGRAAIRLVHLRGGAASAPVPALLTASSSFEHPARAKGASFSRKARRFRSTKKTTETHKSAGEYEARNKKKRCGRGGALVRGAGAAPERWERAR